MTPEMAEKVRLFAWDADCAGDIYWRGVAWRAQAGDESALEELQRYWQAHAD
jgi:hypothetical protein